jgi:hypothetical protein
MKPNLLNDPAITRGEAEKERENRRKSRAALRNSDVRDVPIDAMPTNRRPSALKFTTPSLANEVVDAHLRFLARPSAI